MNQTELLLYFNVLSGFVITLYKNTNKITKLIGVSLIFENTPGTFLFNSCIEKLVYITFCYKYLNILLLLQSTQKCTRGYHHINSFITSFITYCNCNFNFNWSFMLIFMLITNILPSFVKIILFQIVEKIFEIPIIYLLYHLSIYVNINIYTKLYDYHKRNIYYENSTLISDYRFNIIRTQTEYENYKRTKLLQSINQDLKIYIKLTKDVNKYMIYTFCFYICSQIYFPFIVLYMYNLNRILLIHENINKLLCKITM